jgi:long-chain acyl-CoA synthetase
MSIKDYQSIHAMVKETVDRRSDQIAYKWFPEAGRTESATWSQFYEQAKKVSKSLIALDVNNGDKVDIISYSCYKWVITDVGITSIGACTVGIYHSNLAKDCRYIINHSDAVLIFAEDEVQLKKVLEIRKEIPKIRKVILFKGSYKDDWVISFEEFLDLGQELSEAEFYKRVEAVKPQDPAGIVYTSGTTGVPKGAVLTHDNITFTAQSARNCIEIRENDEQFLFLPLAHVFARLCVNFALLTGTPTTFTRSMETIVEDIKAAKPTWFASVPRVYEKVYTKVMSGAEAKGGLALKIFRWACSVGNKVSDGQLQKKPLPALVKLQYQLATKLVFHKIQDALGGNVRWCISGAAPLSPAIGKFFHGAGVLILEGIGMTENTSFTNVNRYDNYRFGWVGLPGPGIEQKVAPDGEILYRGRNVMKEYYKMPNETAETMTPEGWLKTGDLGEIDAENFLRITGRKKELIITAGGKNIASSPIEGLLTTSKYIGQACVLGDRRQYLVALVTLNADNVKAYAQEHGIAFTGIDDLRQNERIIRLVEAEVERKNKDLPSFETVKKIRIVPEFTIENGCLTPTLKIKKNVVAEKCKAEIEAMYADKSGNGEWPDRSTSEAVIRSSRKHAEETVAA